MNRLSDFFERQDNAHGLADALEDLIHALDRSVATWHPLGFVHFRLHEDNEMSFRLHVWLNGVRRVQRPLFAIHTHTFRLESRVLFGAIINSRFKVVPSRTPEQATLYSVKYANGMSRLSPLNVDVAVTSLSRETYHAGEKYVVECGEFHASIVPRLSFTTTLVRAMKAGGSPLVIGRRSTRELSYQRLPLNDDERENIITQLRMNLVV